MGSWANSENGEAAAGRDRDLHGHHRLHGGGGATEARGEISDSFGRRSSLCLPLAIQSFGFDGDYGLAFLFGYH